MRCCSNQPNCPWGVLVMAFGDETMTEIDRLSGVEGGLRIEENKIHGYDTGYKLGK